MAVSRLHERDDDPRGFYHSPALLQFPNGGYTPLGEVDPFLVLRAMAKPSMSETTPSLWYKPEFALLPRMTGVAYRPVSLHDDFFVVASPNLPAIDSYLA